MNSFMASCPRDRIVRVAITAAIGVFMLLAEAKAQAQQVQQVFDNMEVNPLQWTAYNSSGASSSVMMAGPAANAHSGINYGFMTMSGNPSNWSSFGRSVNMSVVSPAHPYSCVADMWMRRDVGAAHGQLEVIDALTWTYVTIQPFDLTSTTYQQIVTSLFALSKPNIFVRVVLIGNNTSQSAFVDDLDVRCFNIKF